MPKSTSLIERLKARLPAWARRDAPVVPVVRLSGPIGMPSTLNGGVTLSIAAVAGALDRAFAVERAPAVAIIVNSPGGSAVQSRLIYQRIRLLAEDKEKPVLVFVEDAAASGGYMIACAGDEIIADPSSIVGSIGVVSASFGFTGLIDKLGVDRRVHTAGERKVTLDPFQPEKPDDIAHLLAIQAEVHDTFVEIVRERRGHRLTPSEETFSGLFWTGKRGVELGLVDRLGDLRGVLREKYGDEVLPVLVNPERISLLKRLFGADVTSFAGATVAAAAETVEARALWSRLGL
ncbi:MAG: S49 family peptidase [Hyphomicrobiaceae bacterium]|nr:S49 family peptidase [Hyphomicrobiaceae bacterium]